jgi:diacylglycerol kinase (ATP)
MTPNHLNPQERTHPSSYKSKGGFQRIIGATRYSALGLKAGWQHEAAFRQEVAIGVLLIPLGLWLAPSWLYGVLMVISIVLVWCVEMVNSAIEALADAISVEPHPLLGRAKDLASAAVLFSLLIVAGVWGTALYQRIFGA